MANTLYDIRASLSDDKVVSSVDTIRTVLFDRITVEENRRKGPQAYVLAAPTKSVEPSKLSDRITFEEIAEGYAEYIQDVDDYLKILSERIGDRLTLSAGGGEVGAAVQALFPGVTSVSFSIYLQVLEKKAQAAEGLSREKEDTSHWLTYKNASVVAEAYEKTLDKAIVESPSKRDAAVSAKGAQALTHSRASASANMGAAGSISRKNSVLRSTDIPADSTVGEIISTKPMVYGNTETAFQTTLEEVYTKSRQLTGTTGEISDAWMTDWRKGSSDDLFANIQDCIPCQTKFSWDAIDWDAMLNLLSFDLSLKFEVLDEWKNLFDRNEVLDDLCALLNLFKNLCPQDINALIVAMTAFLYKLLSGWEFNIASALRDLLSMLLRPYLSGLDEFITTLMQIMFSQADCIMALLQATSKGIKELSFKSDDPFVKKDSPAYKVFDNLESAAKTQREIIRDPMGSILDPATKKNFGFTYSDITADIQTVYQGSLNWIEKKAYEISSTVEEFFQSDWLNADKSLTVAAQLKKVATILSILEILKNIGNIKEKCSPSGAAEIIDKINHRIPDGVVIETDTPVQPSTGLSSGSTNPLNSSSGSAYTGSIFRVNDCFRRAKSAEAARISRWISESRDE